MSQFQKDVRRARYNQKLYIQGFSDYNEGRPRRPWENLTNSEFYNSGYNDAMELDSEAEEMRLRYWLNKTKEKPWLDKTKEKPSE